MLFVVRGGGVMVCQVQGTREYIAARAFSWRYHILYILSCFSTCNNSTKYILSTIIDCMVVKTNTLRATKM